MKNNIKFPILHKTIVHSTQTKYKVIFFRNKYIYQKDFESQPKKCCIIKDQWRRQLVGQLPPSPFTIMYDPWLPLTPPPHDVFRKHSVAKLIKESVYTTGILNFDSWRPFAYQIFTPPPPSKILPAFIISMLIYVIIKHKNDLREIPLN